MRNLISTWAAEWTVSRGLSILTDLQRGKYTIHSQAQIATYLILASYCKMARALPPLLSEKKCTTYLQTILLRKQCAVHLTIVGPYLQCEGVTRNGLTVGRLAPLIAPPLSLATLAVCQRGRAIRSPLKYVSNQTMVFPDPFSLMDNALWACPKYTQPNRRTAGKISRKPRVRQK